MYSNDDALKLESLYRRLNELKEEKRELRQIVSNHRQDSRKRDIAREDIKEILEEQEQIQSEIGKINAKYSRTSSIYTNYTDEDRIAILDLEAEYSRLEKEKIELEELLKDPSLSIWECDSIKSDINKNLYAQGQVIWNMDCIRGKYDGSKRTRKFS